MTENDKLGTCRYLSMPHFHFSTCPDWQPVEKEIVGGAPHGFGIWVEGKFHQVDLGALGKVITDLQDLVRKLVEEKRIAQKIDPINGALCTCSGPYNYIEEYCPLSDAWHRNKIRRW
jgi:hypothetical protein